MDFSVAVVSEEVAIVLREGDLTLAQIIECVNVNSLSQFRACDIIPALDLLETANRVSWYFVIRDGMHVKYWTLEN